MRLQKQLKKKILEPDTKVIQNGSSSKKITQRKLSTTENIKTSSKKEQQIKKDILEAEKTQKEAELMKAKENISHMIIRKGCL